ncbi:lytic transglycosylase domain-containing protein [Pseudochelatococcus sp. B33]
MLLSGSFLIPPIDRIVDHPSDPIACQTAVAHSAGQGRPPRGRHRLALDRSEHDGRLTARGWKSLQTSLHPSFLCIARIGFAGMLVALSGAPCHAGSAPPRPDGTPAERLAVADPYAAFVTEASQRFGIPENWIRAVRHEESADDPLAVSPKGAMGLMQIIPSTWRELRLRYDLGDNPIDPRTNILAGTAYLAELHDRYGSPGFLAAYNAGPARYEEHRLLGVPLPDETRAYLDRLAPIIPGDTSPGLFAGTASHRTQAPQASLFAINMATRSDVSASPAQSLFATDKRRDRQARPADDDSPNVQTD